MIKVAIFGTAKEEDKFTSINIPRGIHPPDPEEIHQQHKILVAHILPH